MYEESVNKIKDIFEGIVIDEEYGKELNVIPYPIDEGDKIDSYPALLLYPDDYSNQFSSTRANRKGLRYRAVLLVKAEGIDNETLYLHTLPRTADKVLEEVDKQWDGGFLEGQNRRVWIKTDMAYFGARQGSDGKVAFLNMHVEVEFQFEI